MGRRSSFFIFLIGTFGVLFLGGCVPPTQEQGRIGTGNIGKAEGAEKTLSIQLKNGKRVSFQIELAKTNEERARGLMFRRELAEDSGMLFVFDEEKDRAFWMKNTLISLDMIFADEKGKIIHIGKNVQPCKADPCPTYPSKFPAQYVFEINAGESEKLGIEVGDFLQLQMRNYK